MANKGITIVIDADDKVDEVLLAIEKQMQRFGQTGAAAAQKFDEGLVSNRESLKLMEESLGVRVPRALNAVLTKFPALAKAVTAAAGGFALLAGGEVIAGVGRQVYELWEKWVDVDAATEKYRDELGKVAEKHFESFAGLEATRANIQGLTKDIDDLQGKIDLANQKQPFWMTLLTGGKGPVDRQMALLGLKKNTEVRGTKDLEREEQLHKEIDQRYEVILKGDENHLKALQDSVNAESRIGEITRATLKLHDDALAKSKEHTRLTNEESRKFNSLLLQTEPAHFEEKKRTIIPEDSGDTLDVVERHGIIEEGRAKAYKQSLETREETAKRNLELEKDEHKNEADEQRNANEIALAALEDQHSRGLVSEITFLEQKKKLADANHKILDDQLKKDEDSIRKFAEFLKHDPRLKRGGSGVSAEEISAQRMLTDAQAKGKDNNARQRREEVKSDGEIAQARLNRQIEGLRLAAQLEAERNDGIKARIALIEFETSLHVKQVQAQGGPGSDEQAATFKALGDTQIAKLKIADIDRQIRDIEQQQRLAIDTVKEDTEAHLISKQQAQKKIADLEAEEARLIQSLLPMYQEQAAFLGGEYLQKVKTLEAEIKKLREPAKATGDKEQIKGDLREGLTSIGDSIVQSSTRGKAAFKDMANSIISDMERMMAKMIEQIFLQRLLNSLFKAVGLLPDDGSDSSGDIGVANAGGGGIPGGIPMKAQGGPISGPTIVGELGPELFVPHTPGTVIPNAGLKGLQGNRGPLVGNVHVNVVNNSSAQVSPTNVSVTQDADGKNFIVSVVLDDLQTNGPIGQAIKIGNN